MKELTLKLLNAFCENIVTFNKCVPIKDAHHIIDAIGSIKGADDLWHVSTTRDKDEPKRNIYHLWKKKEWLEDVERREQLKKDNAKYNTALDERRAIFDTLRRQICYELELGPDAMGTKEVIKIAERMLKKKSRSASLIFGVDLENVPELPTPVKYLDEDIEI